MNDSLLMNSNVKYSYVKAITGTKGNNLHLAYSSPKVHPSPICLSSSQPPLTSVGSPTVASVEGQQVGDQEVVVEFAAI